MSRDDLHARLNAETGRISWPELSTHFARGVTVHIDTSLDLVAVAVAFVENDRETVDAWMKAGQVAVANDANARRWEKNDAGLWAVVVAPWVLVQERDAK